MSEDLRKNERRSSIVIDLRTERRKSVVIDLRTEGFKFWVKNALGSFADCAILFPLIAALAFQSGYSSSILFLTAGLAYLVSGFVFRVPMSVQPLKSIVIAGLAVGASSLEIRMSAGILGLICLALALFDVNKIAKKIPKSLVHGVQLGLGVLLIVQGWKYGITWLNPDSPYAVAPVLSLARSASPLSWGLDRFPLLITLVLPQLALTLANSVLGTQSASQEYFGEQATRVTVKRLLQSIGLGNLISAFVGGLPFCHGSGGVTAHFRGGSTHWISNVIVGTSLVALGTVAWWKGSFVVDLPFWLMAGLLMMTGLFHIHLAQDTWRKPFGKLKLVSLAFMTLVSQNLLWVLALGAGLETVISFFGSGKRKS